MGMKARKSPIPNGDAAPGGLDSWMEGMDNGSRVRVDLYRRMPKIWRGVEIAGIVATYGHAVSACEIAEEHGGGDYALRVKIKDSFGRFVYWKQKNIHIEGPPKIDSVGSAGETGAPWIRCPSCAHWWDTAEPSGAMREGDKIACPNCEAILVCSRAYQPPRLWTWEIAEGQRGNTAKRLARAS